MAITFTISSTSSPSVTVNDAGHGAIVGDFVTLDTANTGNSSLNTLLDKEHEILQKMLPSLYLRQALLMQNINLI
jgi:hypothetical protein